MRVSEVARRAGISSSGVRWYEAAGILPAATRQPNGYRDYSDDDVSRLRLVVTMRHMGLASNDAGRFAQWLLERAGRQELQDAEVTTLLAEQHAVIAERRAELDRVEREIFDLEATLAATERARLLRDGGPPVEPRPISVLFMCRGNSGRSQIGEALLGQLGGSAFVAASAGTEPRAVSQHAVQVLAEAGIDWTGARSKSVTEFEGRKFDYIVTLYGEANEPCPTLPAPHNSLHWRLDDPSAVDGPEPARLAAYRRTRNELSLRLSPFVEMALRAAGELARPIGRARTHGISSESPIEVGRR